MAITDIAARTAKPREKEYKLTDAYGLYLLVKPNGSKRWYLKYRYEGKESRIAFGAYPVVTLSRTFFRSKPVTTKSHHQETRKVLSNTLSRPKRRLRRKSRHLMKLKVRLRDAPRKKKRRTAKSKITKRAGVRVFASHAGL